MPQDAILQMRIAAALVLQLDDLRRHEPDIPSRSEMVRRLIARAADRLPAAKERKR
jgi:hypothetical protein